MKKIVIQQSIKRNILYAALLSTVPSTFAAPPPLELKKAQLEEIIVTARKRDESLQETPVTVSAFSGESLQQLGITNIGELDRVVPGLNMGGGGNGTKGDINPFIRGIGQRETKVTIDGAVGVYVDGLYIGRAAGALLQTVDIESIEVLRGPQGTLFGKNTTGGAIIVNSVKPQEEFGGHFDVTAGNFGRRNGTAVFNLPIVEDKVLSRFTFASVKNDGYMENVLDGRSWSDDDRLTGVGQLRFLADNNTIDFNFGASKTRQNSRAQKCIYLKPELEAYWDKTGTRPKENMEITPLDLVMNQSGGVYTSFSRGEDGSYLMDHPEKSNQANCEASGKDLPNDQFASDLNSNGGTFGQSVYEVNTRFAALTFESDISEHVSLFDGAALKSITGWHQTQLKGDEDLDGNGAVVTTRIMPEFNETNQFSQEFQFTGSALDGKLQQLFGLYYFAEETDNDWIQQTAGYTPVDPEEGYAMRFFAGYAVPSYSRLTLKETDNKAWAVFSQTSLSLTEQLELTLGMRYTEERRSTRSQEGWPVRKWDDLDSGSGGMAQHYYEHTAGIPIAERPYGWVDPLTYHAEGSECARAITTAELCTPITAAGQYGKQERSRKDDAFTPMLSLKYHFNDGQIIDSVNDLMVYGTVSQGFRSGGVVFEAGDFDQDGLDDLTDFAPEEVLNYEMGIKLDALDRSLRANLAAFYTDYTDIQVTAIARQRGFPYAPLPTIVNAGKAEIKGLEAELFYRPYEFLMFTGGMAYTKAEYKKYLVVGDFEKESEKSSNYDFDNPIMLDRSDEPMPRVPEWTAFASIDGFFPIGYGILNPNLNLQYTSEIYNGFDRESFYVGEHLTSDEEIFVNAHLAWTSPEDAVRISLWGKNLTDVDDHITGGIPLVGVAGSAAVIYAPPRTYGIDVSYNF